MDFVFDRVASGRVIRYLVIVDDATHEAIAIMPEHSIGGDHLTRLLDAVFGRNFSILSPSFVLWQGIHGQSDADMGASHGGVVMKLIEPGKPNQNAYGESLNGRFRDECLNEHWFFSLAHARAGNRALAAGIQRGSPEEIARRTSACGVCKATGRQGPYNARRL